MTLPGQDFAHSLRMVSRMEVLAGMVISASVVGVVGRRRRRSRSLVVLLFDVDVDHANVSVMVHVFDKDMSLIVSGEIESM